MPDQLSTDLASLKLDRDEPRPPSSGWLKYALVLAVVAAIGVGIYFVAMPKLESRIFKIEVQATEIASITPAQASVKLTSSGYVVAQTWSDVGPVVSGRIKSISIKEGDRVEQGQVIAILENADRKAAISAARTQVQTAQARAKVAEADLKAAEIKAKRERMLAKEGVSAAGTAEDLEAQVSALKEQVSASKASVSAAGAEVKNLQVNLDYMTVIAPISGTVIGKPVGVGAMVGPFVGAIAKLVDLDSAMVETDVPEARLSMVQTKGPCEIIMDAFPTQRFRGEVGQIGPRVDRAKATITVKVKFIDRSATILPDMAARVNFLTEAIDEKSLKEPPKVVVPASAIADRNGAKVVFVLDGGKVRMRTVTLGKPFGTGFELVDGPPSGTKVVKDPPLELTDGREVKEAGAT
jgi:RND family efflux transporter MFP subunit